MPFTGGTEGEGDARCDAGKHSRSLSLRQIALAVGGLTFLVVGVLVAPASLPVGPALITLGGFVLLVGAAWPLVNQVELGTPMLMKVTVAARARRDQIQGSIQDNRGLMVACAADLCPDPESAVRAVEASVSKTLGYWHGPQGLALQQYLLCVLIQQARYESTTHSRESHPSEPFLNLPLRQREVLVLLDRVGLDRAVAAGILGVPEAEIPAIRAQAMAGLGLSDEAS
jgi:hypothetical protein